MKVEQKIYKMIIPMKKYLITLLICLFSFSLQGFEAPPTPEPPPGISEEPQKETTPHQTGIDEAYTPYLEKAEPEDFKSKFFHMLFILSLIIGFMILASWMLKRMSKVRLNNINVSSAIKIIEMRQLSHKSAIYLIEVEGHHLVVAESSTGIHHLATLPSSPSEES